MEWTMDKISVISILLIYTIKEHVRCIENCSYNYCLINYERESIGECSSSLEDCLQCIEGNVIDLDSKDICVKLSIDESVDELPAVRLNSLLIIPCVFNVPVQCKWELNGEEVNTGEHPRIQLMSTTEIYSKQCSLTIFNVSYEDAGNWTCSNTPVKVDYNTNHTMSVTTRVHVYQAQPQPIKHFPYLLLLIALPIIVVLIIIAIMVYTKWCVKKQSHNRIQASKIESLLGADRFNSPHKLDITININTPLKTDIVAL